MSWTDIEGWWAGASGWDIFGLILLLLLVYFILRNLPDFFRYLKIRSM